MKEVDHQWLDLINKIDGAAEDGRSELKLADEVRRQKYYSLIRRDCQRHQQNRLENQAKKLRERQLIDRTVAANKKQSEFQIQTHKQYEKQFGEDNKRLFKHFRRRTEEAPVPEHPFISLVDGQEKRKADLRNQFVRQNQVNHIQESIKKSQKIHEQQREQEQRRNFENYVQSSFIKRQRQNCEARLKYSWNRKVETLPNENPENEQKKLHKQYLNELQEQINNSKRNRFKTQNSMSNFESQVNLSPQLMKNSASPAFLGKLPFSHDRKRQLQMINKKLGIDTQQINYLKNTTRDHNLPTIDKFRQFHNMYYVRTQPPAQPPLVETVDILFPNISSIQSKKVYPPLETPSYQKNIITANQTPNNSSVKGLAPVMTQPRNIRNFRTYDFLSGQYSTYKVEI